jgi:argininosuccinate lyase
MRAAISPEMFATDRATDLAKGGTPFRDAYLSVAKDLASVGATDIEESLRARVSPGATADLRLPEMRERLMALEARLPVSEEGAPEPHAATR